MEKLLLFIVALTTFTSCGNTLIDSSTENNEIKTEVAFIIAQNYFFRNGQSIPANPKITTSKEFNQLFGMATTMGEEGKPTEIDFSKQFVLATVLPVTDTATEILPIKLEEKNDTLYYSYDIKIGEKLSFSIQPLSIIILDKKYENKPIVVVD